MKARPILFSAPMVRALLAGAKTQTRRVAKFEPIEQGYNLAFSGLHPDHIGSRWVLSSRGAMSCWNERTKPLLCPYGQRGDLLWAREAWRVGSRYDKTPGSEILAPLLARDQGVTVLYDAGGWRSVGPAGRDHPLYADDKQIPSWAGRYRHARFMPRWASRLTLRITDVRVQRLKDINETDAQAEGTTPSIVGAQLDHLKFRAGYMALWDSIHGDGAWDANPWVWTLTIEVIKANVDSLLGGSS